MLFESAAVAVVAMAGLAAATDKCQPRWETRYTATGTAAVAAAAATAKSSSPTSHVKGKAFDRIAIVYFENQNYGKSLGDRKYSTR